MIDSDLGQSGSSATDRVGFQKLVADVGLGQVDIVLGLEVSRLARNNSDWHRLLEICALTDTLILDEDGIGKSLRRALNLAQRSTALPDLPESFAFTAWPRPCRQGKARFKLPLRFAPNDDRFVPCKSCSGASGSACESR